jgi:hypothetical protein
MRQVNGGIYDGPVPEPFVKPDTGQDGGGGGGTGYVEYVWFIGDDEAIFWPTVRKMS